MRGAGRGAGRQVREGQGRGVLPFHVAADAVLWGLLGLCAVGPAEAGSRRAVQLARCGVAPVGSGDTSAVQQLSDRGKGQCSGVGALLTWVPNYQL